MPPLSERLQRLISHARAQTEVMELGAGRAALNQKLHMAEEALKLVNWLSRIADPFLRVCASAHAAFDIADRSRTIIGRAQMAKNI